jgi:hypothetical protein
MSDLASDQANVSTDDLTGLTPITDQSPAPETTDLPIGMTPSNDPSPVPETTESATQANTDPVTGGANDPTQNPAASDGNEILIALGSTIDSSTNLNVTNNYVTYQTYQNVSTYNYTNYQTYQTVETNNPATATAAAPAAQAPAPAPAPAAAATASSPAQDSNSLRRSGHRYIFNSKEYFSSNVKQRRVDRILNFSPSDGDALALSRKRFSGIDKLDFTQVNTKKELKSAARGDFDVIYLEPRGELYFNQNADARGFGRGGGLFAILETAPSISSEQFTLM